MKRNFKISFTFKYGANLRPYGVQEIILQLTYGQHIKEAFEKLYKIYGNDFNGIASIEAC